tara:strand:+ start:3900 stop:4187 length:288 start_codon:yes stop_codon:yes gene_type:complete
MNKGDKIKIVKLGEARMEKAEAQRFGSTRYTTEKITIKPGDILTFTGSRTPVGQSWGTVEFFELEDGREVRLPEIDILAGCPPILDESYFEVMNQ